MIDTDSRAVPGEQAYRRVKEAVAALKQRGYDFIYKKMDSTLRGNLGQEIDAVLDVYGFEGAMVVPAFPRIGRTTLEGVHYLNGVPIHETEISRDPKTPVPTADIGRLLAGQSTRTSANVSAADLRGGPEAVDSRIREALAGGAGLIVFDAESDEDMQRIAELVPAYGRRFLWAGSAGLAEYLPMGEGPDAAETASQEPDGKLPVMLVAGSVSKVTREQVAAVNGQEGIVPAELDPIRSLASAEREAEEKERRYSVLSGALQAGSDVSLFAGTSPEQVLSAQRLGAERGLDPSGVSGKIADALGEVAARLVGSCRPQGLVLTGGDTAKAVCRHLGVHGIELVAEVEPGIPLGRLIGAGGWRR
ncbi:four-carbon acid sugar kinase family protein [Paenibacillus sp. P26]|nr:four-carbon acid sugar kinase family protein [Paenibacillus sp. P26]